MYYAYSLSDFRLIPLLFFILGSRSYACQTLITVELGYIFLHFSHASISDSAGMLISLPPSKSK